MATTKKPATTAKCTGAIRKQLVRNITVTPRITNRPPRAYRHCHFQLPNDNAAERVSVEPSAAAAVFNVADGGHRRTNYQSPKLQSTLAIAREIEKITLAPIPAAKTTDDLTPRSKAFVNEQVQLRNYAT